MIHAHLCIGGPFDGKMVPSDHSSFSVPVLTEGLSLRAMAMSSPGPVAVEHCQYVQCSIHTADGNMTFWVPQGTSAFEVLRRLSAAYHWQSDLSTRMSR